MEHQHRRKVLAYRYLAMLNATQSSSVDDGLCQRKYRILRALIGESIMTVHEALHSRVEIKFGTAGFAEWNGMLTFPPSSDCDAGDISPSESYRATFALDC